MLGINYMDEDPDASDLSAIEFFETKIQAGLALTRCAEPGTAVQDIARTSAEARRAYVPSTARPPAGADDIDERVLNPCIAAGIARNPELAGVTPWEVRNIYPETYDPLAAQMRANMVPVLAEFGDDARARNILLDRFRDDCIRGARGRRRSRTGPGPKSASGCRSLARGGHSVRDSTAQCKWRTVFPRRAVRLPWIEHTPVAPIASWMDPSDIGWLCESAQASEYVSTPGRARFCYTTGGERGWEQGFFGCESAPDARQRALRNDWLQGWKRNQ